MEKEKFEIGDLLLITLKGNHSIVEIADIDLDDTQCTYNFNCLYGIYLQADGWICNKEYNIIKKVDTSFVDELFEDNDLHKIGSKVYFDGEEDFIKYYDRYGDEYYLENYDDWVSSSDIEIELVNESTFKVGDLVKSNGVIYKIKSDIDSDGDYQVEFIIGDYHKKCDTLSKDNLESATQEDINYLQEDFEFKIGEKVLCNGKEATIKAIDTDKNTSKKFRTDYWAYDDHLKKLVSEITFKVGDLVKVIGKNDIYKVCGTFEDISEILFLIGSYNYMNDYIEISNDKLESATQEDIDNLQKDFKFKIGDEVLYENKNDKIIKIDISCIEGKTYYLDSYDDWVKKDDVFEISKLANFKVGDLVKIKNEGNSILKVVEIYSLTNIHTELIIGEVGDEGSYESSDLELTTQEELNRFQQGYLFKIGDKVLYDDEIDIIKSIDMNDDEQTYLLLNADDWVTEYDISTFTESEKSDEVVKVVETDKVEPTIKTTKKRILLGAC